MNKNKVIRYILVCLILIILIPTAKITYKNKQVEKAVKEATIHFLEEECDLKVNEVTVEMEWLRLAKRFGDRSWKVNTDVRDVEGSISKNVVVSLSWSGCRMGELQHGGGYILNEKEKRFFFTPHPEIYK
ncbi:hypothetical protein [Bacillus alkalicellulosilyticus]|uniref:hypothetical protein n=1 Tax=Alkalihalobacterium alkalicellulosilyticum TaxID=1912214 RepID=UPI00099747FC|nr:hypothetical protein [Bacillus alkalicellulosilyticus]